MNNTNHNNNNHALLLHQHEIISGGAEAAQQHQNIQQHHRATNNFFTPEAQYHGCQLQFVDSLLTNRNNQRHLRQALVGASTPTSASELSPSSTFGLASTNDLQMRLELAAPSAPVGKLKSALRMKKARTLFSTYQLTMLETTFQQSPYPDGYTRRDLAQRLGLDEIRVQVWFQNRRAKWRKKANASQVNAVVSAKERFG